MMVRRVLVLFGCATLATCSLEFDEFTFNKTVPQTTVSSSASSGGAGGQVTGDCQSPNDCQGQDTTCEHRTCANSICGMESAAVGTPCTENGGAMCDGLGQCVECVGGTDCATGVCDNGTCGPCVNHTDCGALNWCDNGACAPVKMAGEPCADPAECQNGNCADLVCCDSACNALCEGCTAALTGGMDGTCAPITFAQDPDMECTPPAYCQGDGTCGTCGQATPPTGGSCPAMCTGGCANNICVVECNGNQECMNDLIVCPPFFACELVCTGSQGCRAATLVCPADHACSVECDNSQACRDINIVCSGQGPCDMSCSAATNVCQGANLNCGNSSCIAACAGGSTPAMSCGNACWCDPC